MLKLLIIVILMNNLTSIQVKISKFKADGAGVLLDRVHTYKTQLACSDQEKSELLLILENRDKVFHVCTCLVLFLNYNRIFSG